MTILALPGGYRLNGATLGMAMRLGIYQENQLGTMFWNRIKCIIA
jgi:hypothetical protein